MTMETEFGQHFFEDVIGWVADNCDPESIFSEYRLIVWARYWACQQIATDVLSEERLIEWAESNGFVREE